MIDTRRETRLFYLACSFAIFLALACSTSAFGRTIGPYTGRVIDNNTGKPISGASVLIYHIKTIPAPLGGGTDLPLQVSLVYTDNDGKYNVQARKANMGLIAFLDSTHVIIYEPGYVAYIVRMIHHASHVWAKKIQHFKDQDNLVKLQRIPSNFDHRAHYKKIDRALDNLYENETGFTDAAQTKLRMTGPILEKREFLRRVEWEKRRPAFLERRR